MLGVNGDKLTARCFKSLVDNMTEADKSLLVCHGDTGTRISGGKGGRNTCHTGNCVDDKVASALADGVAHGAFSRIYLYAFGKE